MGETLTYNDGILDHKCHASTLGLLQRGIDKGHITAERKPGNHAYYAGHELLKLFPLAKSGGITFLKADCTGSGKVPGGRSKNRIVVAVKDGKVVDGEAYLWRHDDRVLKLGPNFFTRATMFRKM